MDIRQFTNKNAPAAGFVPNQLPSQNDAGTTNLTDEERSAIDKGNPDELSNEMVKEYLSFLEEHDISQSQIFQVLDNLIANTTLRWSFDLLGRVPVVFTVRPAWVNSLILERVQDNPPKTYSAFNDLVSTANLAGSITKYGKADFSVTDIESFDKVKDFIQSLPFIIKAQLVKHLAIFDRVVSVATSDWAVKNFQKPSAAG